MAGSESLSYNNRFPVYVYEWKAWTNFMFPSIFNNAIRIEAKLRQSSSGIIKKLLSEQGYFLFHINLTKTAFFFKNKEDLLARLKTRGIIPLNAEIHDTSKRYIQQVCKQTGLNTTRVSAEGDENELLIIKTNFNYGGRPEKRLLRSHYRRLNLSTDDYSTDILYPVMQRKKIEKEVWNNENLVVEKYINNQQNCIYRVYKLLNKMVVTEVIENSIIKKMESALQRTNYYYNLKNDQILPRGDLKFVDLLASIIPLCNALHLDFAAIDVVKSDENKYYVIDVNVTPTWNRSDQNEKLKFLAEGLYDTNNQPCIKV